MLVLSRKKNESIVINDDITIVVVEIRGDKVRLGVEAPNDVPGHRREVYEAIRRVEISREKKDVAPTNGGEVKQDEPTMTETQNAPPATADKKEDEEAEAETALRLRPPPQAVKGINILGFCLGCFVGGVALLAGWRVSQFMIDYWFK
jgi:carbon storage regulator